MSIIDRLLRGPVGQAPPPPKPPVHVPAPRTSPPAPSVPKSGGGGGSRPSSEGGGQAPRRALPLPAGIDPESKLGKVLVEPSPVVHEGKIVPGTMTTQQYHQKQYEAKTDIGRQKSEYFAIQESIEPTSTYRYKGVLIPGFLVKRRIEKEYLPQLEKAEVQSQLAWSQARDIYSKAHPETKIVKTDKGYNIKYPFAGAEDYYTYKKQIESDPGRATALGWGWGGLGNIDVAIDKLRGKPELALEKQIGQLARYKLAKETLKSGDVLGFSGHYWRGYFESPATQIGIAYAGGAIATKAVPYLAGVATAKFGIAGGLAVKGGALATGVYFGGTEAINIKNLWERGRAGEAAGKGWLLGSQIIAAYGGYKHVGGRAGMARFEQKGYQRGTQFDSTVFKKYIPQSVKNVYGRLTREIGGFKTRASLQKYYGRVSSLATEKQLAKADIFHAKQLAKRYEMGDTGFPRYSSNVMESDVLSGRFFKPELFSWKHGVSRPLSLAHLHGRRGMVSSREGLTTLEQISGKRPDPFVSYKAKDVWGMSWDAYRTTTPYLVSEIRVTKVPFKIDYGKGLTYSDTILKTERMKVWQNMFAEQPYRARPELVTGQFPKEFTTGISPKIVDYGIFKSGKTPFRIVKPKVSDVSVTPSKTGQQTVSIYKGPSTGTRFKLLYDVTDMRFLSYLESLEPMYKPTTGVLAPSHIKRGMDVRIPTMKKMDGVIIFDTSLSLGGRTRMMPDFDIVQVPKIKHMPPVFETMHKGITKTDYKQGLDTSLTMRQVFDTASLMDVKTDQLLGQVQETKQIQAFDEMLVAPQVHTMQPLFPDFPMMDLYQPGYPTRPMPRKPFDFFGVPIDKGLYGRGRMYGGMEFFGKAKKFRKGELDVIFGIEV